MVTVTENRRTTPETHWQDVRHLHLTTEDTVRYGPGDVLALRPNNFPDDVEQFVSLMGWSPIADRPVRFVQALRSRSPRLSRPPLPQRLMALPDMTVRSLLTRCVDIMSVPRRSFFALAANFASDSYQKARLLEFTDPRYLDELYDYTTRPRRSVLEVLQEFDSVKLPWQWAVHALPIIRPRQFSIASGGRLKSADHGGTRFELLVAIVKYRTVIKRIRHGLCTRYVASLSPGDKIDVVLHRGGLDITDADLRRPSVLIGPGTGVAPMRSLIYEKLALRNARSGADQASSLNDPAGDSLFFGCRNQAADYFFHDEWQQLAHTGQLGVFVAFSRDQVRHHHHMPLVARLITPLAEAKGVCSGFASPSIALGA